MREDAKEEVDKKDEIKIPFNYIKRIDKIIGTGMSVHLTREGFIISAVQMKLANLNEPGLKKFRRY